MFYGHLLICTGNNNPNGAEVTLSMVVRCRNIMEVNIMLTICFKGGIKLDFPKECTNIRFFNPDTNYRLETVIDKKKAFVSFNGRDVLYVSESE